MELYEMIYSRLRQDTQLEGLTAKYNGGAAVFYQRTAPQSDSRWESEIQYPRIDYILDMMENPERNSSGVLTVNVWCDTQVGAEPEDIEYRLRALLHASFAQTDDMAYCFAWVRTDAFEVKQQKEETVRTIGVTVLFDVMACPALSTLYPDPVKAMNDWTKEILPNSTVIGKDTFTGWITPTRANPVIYWRLTGQTPKEKHFTHTWMDITLEGHVYCINAADRLYNIAQINTAEALAGHIPMEDTSPLFLKNFSCRPHMNYMKTGQIHTEGTFGLLQPTSHLRSGDYTGEEIENASAEYSYNPD